MCVTVLQPRTVWWTVEGLVPGHQVAALVLARLPGLLAHGYLGWIALIIKVYERLSEHSDKKIAPCSTIEWEQKRLEHSFSSFDVHKTPAARE